MEQMVLDIEDSLYLKSPKNSAQCDTGTCVCCIFTKHHKSRYVISKILQGTLIFGSSVDNALELGQSEK